MWMGGGRECAGVDGRRGRSDFSFSRHNNNGSYLSDRWACHFWRAVGGLCTCRVFTTENEHRSVAKTLILVQHNKVDG